MDDHAIITYDKTIADYLLKLKGVRCIQRTEDIAIDLRPEEYQKSGIIHGTVTFWQCGLPWYINNFQKEKITVYDYGPESSGEGFQ